MDRIMIALRDLISSNVATNEALVSNALIGDYIITIADTSKFKPKDEIFMMRNSVSSTVVENSRLTIQSIPDYRTLVLSAPLSNDFLVSASSSVQKAINYQLLQCIYLGDLPAVPTFPCITISPMSEDNEWLTLRGTAHDYKFQIRLYVLADNFETTNIYLPKMVRYVREVLIDHIHPLVDAVSFPLTADLFAGSTVVSISNTSSWERSVAFLRDRSPRPSTEENSIATILSGTNMELRGATVNDYLVARGAEIFQINRYLYDTRPSGINLGFTAQKGGVTLKVAEFDYFAKEYICRDTSLIS